MAKDKINIEVALAFPYEQQLVALRVELGTSIRSAVEQSKIFSLFNNVPAEVLNLEYGVGIFGQEIKDIDNHSLQEGDRIEIYRPLLIDPKQARFKRVAKKKETDKSVD